MEQEAASPVLTRLDDQIAWYSRHSGIHRRSYESLKLVAIAAAGAIPLLAVLETPTIYTALLGSILLGIEGIQQLFPEPTAMGLVPDGRRGPQARTESLLRQGVSVPDRQGSKRATGRANRSSNRG